MRLRQLFVLRTRPLHFTLQSCTFINIFIRNMKGSWRFSQGLGEDYPRTHLSKGKSDLEQKYTQLLTTFSSIVFQGPFTWYDPFGSDCSLLRLTSRKLPIGTFQQFRKGFRGLRRGTKQITPYWVWKTEPDTDFRNCADLCLRSFVPFGKMWQG